MKKLKFLLLIVSMAVLLGLISGCLRSTPYKNFNSQIAHHGKDQFVSQMNDKAPLWRYFKMRLREGSIASATQQQIDAVMSPVNHELIHADAPQPRITWIGHATALIQYKNRSILTDPHLTMNAAPVANFGPVRAVPPALKVDELPNVDYVVISHNHYDHLDHDTVELLGNDVHWLVPLGLKKWLMKRDISPERITELDWWQQWDSEEGAAFTLTPAKHWSKRTLFDTNKTLWGSWSIQLYDFKVWFGGDTGYDGDMFKDIGSQLGPFDLALIPIGAYSPRYFMAEQHIDPEQAIMTHQDIRAKTSIGIHWGTFELTHEPFLEPRELLNQLIDAESINGNDLDFKTLNVGETLLISKPLY